MASDPQTTPEQEQFIERVARQFLIDRNDDPNSQLPTAPSGFMPRWKLYTFAAKGYITALENLGCIVLLPAPSNEAMQPLNLSGKENLNVEIKC